MTSTGERRPLLDEDALFDAYLDACRAGVAEGPAAFCARHPGISEDLRASIEALWAETQAKTKPAIDRLGDCDILEPLDRGGMGLIYLARQRSLDRLVVVKVIRPELRSSDTARARFKRESEAAAKLHHPYLVQVLDVGEERDVAYMVMEYVPGRSLGDLIKDREPPAWREYVAWTLQLARALDYAHGEGVIHRDVKPSNVRIDRAGAPKLIDFGVARTAGATQAALTTTFAGSPLYAAPEQLMAKTLDGRADVYGLGATLYECVTGRPPFPGESLEQVLREVLVNDPLPPRRLVPALPRDLESVLLKAIEKDPDRRYPSAAALADDLERVLDDRPVTARPPNVLRRAARWGRRHPTAARLIAGAALLVVFAATVAVWQARERRRDARSAVATARERLEVYVQHVAETRAIDKKLAHLKEQLEYRHLTEEENALLDTHETQVARRWRERDAIARDVLHELRRAERLDPGIEGTDKVRAALYVAQWRDAERRREVAAGAFYRQQAERLDPSLVKDEEVDYRVTIESEPRGADVYLFVMRTLETEPRKVPIPIAGTPATKPGTRMRVDGFLTAAPFLITPESLLGKTPVEFTHDDSAEYVALVRRTGYDDVRVHLRPSTVFTLRFQLELTPRGTGPAGYVYVVPQLEPINENEPPFWGMRHEVTAEQYREFLNAVGDDKRVPRERADYPMWSKRDGKWELAGRWKPDWPVTGISWYDAQAYAEWRTKNDPKWRYSLPTFVQWRIMGGMGFYPFGDHFRPRWVSSCYTRPTASLVPVMSYPVDQSVFGIYDLSGSASEWLDAWYDKARNLRRLGGGSWGHTDPEMFKVMGGTGMQPERLSGAFGMRLIARPKK